MKYILLSGGSEKGLWPLSNSVRSNQFLKLFQNEEGALESSIQILWKQLQQLHLGKDSMFVTNAQQSELLYNQCGRNIKIIEEPVQKNTFSAICLAALYMKEIEQCNEDEWIAILPVDLLIKPSFLHAVQQLPKLAMQHDAPIGLIGFPPTYIETEKGYIDISPGSTNGHISIIQQFIEMPSMEVAKQLIDQGALWNSGVYVFQIKTLLQVLNKLSFPIQYEQFVAQYDTMDIISFDYAMIEQIHGGVVYRYEGEWQDIGSWDRIAGKLSTEQIGIGSTNGQCENTHILNELLLPIHVVDVDNIIVAASYDGILVTNKHLRDEIKYDVKDTLAPQIFEERHWGNPRILEQFNHVDGKDVLVLHIQLSIGKNFSYHRHRYRSETWTIIEGEGELIVENEVRRVKAGDVIQIKVGQLHALKAITNLQFIEVQSGNPLIQEDVEQILLDWDDISHHMELVQSELSYGTSVHDSTR